jgi:hypothetical protein
MVVLRLLQSGLRMVPVMSLALAAACASQAPQKADANGGRAGGQEKLSQPAATKAPQGSQSQQGGSVQLSCLGSGLALYEPGEGTIDGRGITVFTGRDRQTKSLCDVVAGTGKKAAIFQFSGIDCISCQQEAVEFKKQLAADPSASQLAYVVVVTDFFDDVRDDRIENFKTTYASGASAVVFDEAAIWKRFSANPAMPNRTLMMAMNLDQQAVVINRKTEDENPDAQKNVQEILAAAKSLLAP